MKIWILCCHLVDIDGFATWGDQKNNFTMKFTVAVISTTATSHAQEEAQLILKNERGRQQPETRVFFIWSVSVVQRLADLGEQLKEAASGNKVIKQTAQKEINGTAFTWSVI